VPAEEAAISYVLPLRWRDDRGLDELTRYLRWLSQRAEVIVVDGSAHEIWRRHNARWAGMVRHLAPDGDLTFASGKVNGVTTGIRRATCERVVIADDDVRYDEASLTRMVELLGAADLVRPQNHFRPLPWHARWDSARSMINRAVSGGDFPGTLGVRRSTFLTMGGYNGDVLFENLELMRTVDAAGGVIDTRLDLFVRRLPPTTRHFLSQRVRQAYDDFALPRRMAAFLAVLPAIAVVPRRRRIAVGAITAVSVLLAELGRRRAGARAVVPWSVSLMAPLWVAERAICAWLAVALRIRLGGVTYGGVVVRCAATSPRALRRRLASRSTATS